MKDDISAFPTYVRDRDDWLTITGMTLRDYFAGQALMGRRAAGNTGNPTDVVANLCYADADAMLKAREA